MTFSFGYTPWLLVLSLIIAGGMTYWSYRTTIPTVSSGRRWLLGLLRFASLALICLLLLEPVIQYLDQTEKPPVLAVLVDNSESMRVVHGDTSDASPQSVRDSVRSILSPIEENVSGTIRYFGFDANLRSLPESSIDSLTLSGNRTNISTALQSVQDELQGENVKGIALVSDGQYNTGRNPARVADRFPVPVHTITVGDTSRRRDLQIRQVATNDVAYVDTEVPVRVIVGAEDLAGETTTVSLRQDGSILDAVDVSLSGNSIEPSMQLTFRPQSAGLKQLSVQASPVPNEATTENNVRTVSLRVLENKRQVLLLGAAPSPNYAALHRILSRDANTNVTARVPQADGSYYGGALPDTLSAYDVIVSAGFPSSGVPTSDVRRIAQHIDDGTPAVFLLDGQTDISAWRDQFGETLPITPDGSGLEFVEATFAPIEAERSHPVFQIEDADVRLVRDLPPLSTPTTAWTPTPDAQVLAEAVRPGLSRRDPMLVVRQRAGHRSAAFLGTGTWRWATLPTDLERADPLWPELVSNLLRWVATESDDRQVRVRPTASTFEGNQSVDFTGQVYDESMSPVSKAQVSLTITDSTGTTYPHSMEPEGNGRYSLNVGTLPKGTYRYSARAQLDDATLGTDQGQFSVGALRLEYQKTRANAVLMRQLSARSGGTAYGSGTANALPSDLATSSTFSSTVVTNTTETELWRRTLFLVVLLGLLAAEWTLRKRFGLS